MNLNRLSNRSLVLGTDTESDAYDVLEGIIQFQGQSCSEASKQ
jgi:hypothetical protein